ncbi:unnamed protein product [Rotaria magnacalcarata]|uniref:Uncharacterized protein n=1 Tax=Rotaria magnacalcarata TaxID=392030 RepID=A0A815UEV4_9BILA|nr:unnamed protein product [Rotaria magnacalcarata]CAF2063601.1 unnamed protein product [Rotaria magnacalcarata]
MDTRCVSTCIISLDFSGVLATLSTLAGEQRLSNVSDVIENHTRILSTQYLLAVVDRPGYNSKTLWKEILENVTSDNRQRLIWIAPWTGEMRSSTQLRKLVTNVTSDHVTLRQDLRDLVPTSCIDYILEYNIEQWFQ